MPRKPRLCARCHMAYAAHAAGVVGSCSRFRAMWTPPRFPRPVRKQGVERVEDNYEGEK
jgi:hypothetical protein